MRSGSRSRAGPANTPLSSFISLTSALASMWEGDNCERQRDKVDIIREDQYFELGDRGPDKSQCIQSTFTHPLTRLRKIQRKTKEAKKDFRAELGKMDTQKGSRSDPDADVKRKIHVFLFEASTCCLPWVSVLYSLMSVTLVALDLSWNTFCIALSQKAAWRNIPASSLCLSKNINHLNQWAFISYLFFSFFFSLFSSSLPSCYCITLMKWVRGERNTAVIYFLFFIISSFLSVSKLLLRQS